MSTEEQLRNIIKRDMRREKQRDEMRDLATFIAAPTVIAPLGPTIYGVPVASVFSPLMPTIAVVPVVFSTSQPKTTAYSRCKASGCKRDGCVYHYCEKCKDTNADHIDIDCPLWRMNIGRYW